jgi:hypothetical protein
VSKTYLIETRQTFIIGYAVVMDDDMDPKTIAGKIIADVGHGGELPTELYQYDAGEVFEQCIPLNDGQLAKVFRAKNEYIANWTDEEITEKFLMDFRTNKDA